MEEVEQGTPLGKLGGKTYGRILSILGVVVFAAILYYGGVEALRQLAQVNLPYLGCAFVAAGLAAFVTSARWGLIVDSLEGHSTRSRLQYFYYVMVGKISSTFVSQYVGDYGVRPLALKASSKTSMGHAFYSVLLDRLFDLALSLLFLVPGVLFVGGLISPEVLMVLVLVLIGGYWAVSARNHHLLSGLLGLAVRALRGIGRWLPKLDRVVAKLANAVEGARDGFERLGAGCIIKANVLTLARYLAMAMRAYFIAWALNLPIPFWLVFLAVGLVRFTLLFAVAPGRLGVLEVGWYGILALGGVQTSTIIPFLLGLRLYGLVFNAVLALMAHLATMFSRSGSA
jgi:uncharacterized protein (TIRG00374 family)